MNILIVGVSGFIGQHLYKVLKNHGHNLKGCSRHIVPDVNWVYFDFYQTQDAWLALLDGVDIVINAAGVYKETKDTEFKEVHTDGPIELFKICHKKNIRVLQISAVGAERENPVSEFLRSKREADQYLLKSHLPQVVLYPGIVLGEGGKSTQQLSLLARQYIRPMVFKKNQEIPLISIDQLTDEVVGIVIDWPNENITKVIAGKPESVETLLKSLRNWMGLKRYSGIEVYIPESMTKFLFKLLPDFNVGSFDRQSFEMLDEYQLHKNWKLENDTADSTASELLSRNKVSGDFIRQRRLELLYYLNLIVLSLIWVMSGISSLINMEQSREIIYLLEVDGKFADAVIIVASLLDILLGVFLWVSRYRTLVIYFQIAIMLSYSILISLFIPLYWLHPFAPVIKNFAVLILGLYLLVDKKEK